MSIHDDETLQMYVEESREHLADIENDLLLIEETGANIDENLVNKVFRAAHSIKGGAGFMGLNKIKELAHKIENILDMVRSRELVPNPEVINILLLAFDKLRELVNNVDNSDQIDISEHLVTLSGLTSASLPSEEKESVSQAADIRLPDGEIVFSVTAFDLSRARKGGKFVYVIEYDLIHDVHYKDKTLLDLLTGMEASGTILEGKVDFESVGSLDNDQIPNRIPFFVLFATIIEPGLVEAIFEVGQKYVHVVGEDGVANPLDECLSGKGGKPAVAEEDRTRDSVGVEQKVEKIVETAKPAPPISQEKDTRPLQAPGLESGSEARTASQVNTKETAPSESSLRVGITLLDTLMTLAGELVLSRNQLLQALSCGEQRSLELASQRVNLVTSELQEAIMQTRMQPIGNIFNKFPRVVRDLARDLGKEVLLILDGKEVEMDKTIIEGLNDPLTHLVRNAVDHGIELPEVRRQKGKDQSGQIVLKAYHEAGQVNIEISDDGKGLDGGKLVQAAMSKGLVTEEQARTMSEKEKINLIFLPGFSTAERVSDVSGRGVGMDVVKTNLNRLGGQVHIESEPGIGTTVRIKLPLTLAIIPSLLVSCGHERYAVPQVNLEELLRISASQVRERIELVGDAEVVRLRETLLPILSLHGVLGIEKEYNDPESSEWKVDRRETVADRRGRTGSSISDARSSMPDHAFPNRRIVDDRRYHAGSSVNIAVVSVGAFKYGLVVDELHDSEEIVVKPLGRHLKGCRGYAGATILGDGCVALILDVADLARMAGITSLEGTERAASLARAVAKSRYQDVQSLLLFRNAMEEQFAVPLDLVARIEQINASDIEEVSGKKSIQYRGGTLPLFAIEEVARVKPRPEDQDPIVIVFSVGGREVGLLATPPVDAAEVSAEFDHTTLKQTGIMGSSILNGYTTLIVDIFEFVETLNPQWFADKQKTPALTLKKATVLLAEDSDFFRAQITKFMEESGYTVLAAQDGAIAWDLLQQNPADVSVVVTDIEMPNLNGYDLTRKIKEDGRFSHLPVIAVTSLAGEENMAIGKAAGVDDYQIKLDREKLMASLARYAESRC
jgi:two-component system, chemotaxis family, sensor kinase CheA